MSSDDRLIDSGWWRNGSISNSNSPLSRSSYQLVGVGGVIHSLYFLFFFLLLDACAPSNVFLIRTQNSVPKRRQLAGTLEQPGKCSESTRYSTTTCIRVRCKVLGSTGVHTVPTHPTLIGPIYLPGITYSTCTRVQNPTVPCSLKFQNITEQHSTFNMTMMQTKYLVA